MRVFQGEAAPFGVNANAYRGMLPVNDAAEAFVELLLSDQTGMVNICSGEPVAISDVVRSVARLFDADPDKVLRLASTRPGDPPLLVGNSQRLRSTGWALQTSISQCLQDTLSLQRST
jgi:nucleoside-diphosphate-sugar epimerase